MLSLSPAKLLVILVIALVVLGPDKLPQLARQAGALWHDLRRWRSRVESEVRGTFPNLPPTHEVAQAVRSPFAFLDRLADEHERSQAEGAEEGGTSGEGAPASVTSPPGQRASSGSALPPGNELSGNGTSAGNGASWGNGVSSGSGSSSGSGASSRPDSSPAEALSVAPDDPSMN